MKFHDAVVAKSRNSWKPVTIQQSIKIMHVKDFIAVQIENATNNSNIKSLVPIEDFANAVMDITNNVVRDFPIRSALYEKGDERVTIIRNVSNIRDSNDSNEAKEARSKSKRKHHNSNLKYQITIKNINDEISYTLNRQSFVRLVRYVISEFIGLRGFG